MVTGDPSSTDPGYDALIASDVADVELVNADVTAPNPPVVAPSNGTVVTGTAEANSSVIISMTSGGTTTTATVQTDGSGNFSYTPATALANGTTVTATATDASGNTSANSNTITVIDATPASITGPSGAAGSATASKSIAENTTAVHTFTASETVTWSIASGADGSKFAISSTGALSFVQAPDFESPTDNGTNNTYEVCLLYTSPSPRDGLLSRMPSSA